MTHWTDNDLMEWLYGLKEDPSHLNACVACRTRAESMSQRKAEATQAPEISWEFLAAQRRSIYQHLGRPVLNWASVRWSVSGATLAAAAILSFSLLRPGGSNFPLVTPEDEKLFSDLVTIEQSNEPRAIHPIRNLFVE